MLANILYKLICLCLTFQLVTCFDAGQQQSGKSSGSRKVLGSAARGLTQWGPTSGQWSVDKANTWYRDFGFEAGADYTPKYAVNQIEFWYKDTYDGAYIDTELEQAQGLGFKLLRIFTHDLLWLNDKEGLISRLTDFLSRADKRGMKVIVALFDSCWNPSVAYGKQPEPTPGIHNSQWVQGPGKTSLLAGESDYPRLQAYVEGIVSTFKTDHRIISWDIWNEPSNTNPGSYENVETPNKIALIEALLPKAFQWARNAQPDQPLTSPLYDGDWSSDASEDNIQKIQTANSDIITFHNYGQPNNFADVLRWSQRFGRPIICTEYLNRPGNNLFENILPLGKQANIGMVNWGLVAGRTQTYFPCDSWQRPYTDGRPFTWQHVIFYGNFTPYNASEPPIIKSYTLGK